jgi:tetratricopeptide (TPR) repeat protein
MEKSPPVDGEAFRLMRAGRLREALPLAERAVATARRCQPGHAFLASILLQLGRTAEAEGVVVAALALEQGDADAYDGLAYVSLDLDRHERAHMLYQRATELSPDTPRHWYNLACSQRSLGRLAEAEQACERCLALDPGQYPTYMLRSELRVQSPEANHIAELRARLAGPRLDSGARATLGYALAKELDDLGLYDEAFNHFTAAARARRSQIRYDIARDEHTLRRIAAVFTGPGARAASNPAAAAAASRCIFVVGLPRSGTTLVERILSGLAGVRSNGETDNFSRALAATAPKSGARARPIPVTSPMSAATTVTPNAGTLQKDSGDIFERAVAADPQRVAAEYLRRARLGDSERVIEKQPTNYLYLGAISRALPQARLLLVRRSPLDSCFAMYRTLFGEAFPFTYDFEELARYYAAYERLVNHWRRELGDRLHEIIYEDLVRDPGTVGAAAAQHCGLPWAASALDIQNNHSASLTASAAQVRRPIYGSSSGRWRHYRHHLAPLLTALRRHGVSLPEDA